MDILNGFLFKARWKFRGIFNGLIGLVFIILILHQGSFSRQSFSIRPAIKISQSGFNKNGVRQEGARRRIVENLDNSSSSDLFSDEKSGDSLGASKTPVCTGIYDHQGYDSKCEYLRDNPGCDSGGYFNYIKFFYCNCNNYSGLGYLVLAVWLVALFYLLGNTAADYFCCCLEKLSNLLRLPPTVAGVTLLPLGNGAPDVFASIAAFVGNDSGGMGLNSVLGGAVFVTCVVVGTVALCVTEQGVQIDKKCFLRDVCFFIFVIFSLLMILIRGEVSVGVAMGFFSIYVVYAVCVAANEILRKHFGRSKADCVTPLLPVTGSDGNGSKRGKEGKLEKLDSKDVAPQLEKLPHWLWTSNVAIYSNEAVKVGPGESPEFFWGWNDEHPGGDDKWSQVSCSKVVSLLELPLMLTRRLTIPIVDETRWSKFYAVGSASLAPLLLSFLWNTQDKGGSLGAEIVYIIGAGSGGVLGGLAFVYTKPDRPPEKFLFPWIFGGFFMSIIWFYIVANELVALLVAFGVIFGINPSLLALTVLAWGNSMGDLISNVAIAMNNRDGVQIAMSGSYAGPMFNTLVGLGISMMLGAWSKQPDPYTIPRDNNLYYTLGFLMLALLFTLVVLPRNGMRPSRLLGLGLMTIYLVFLSVRATIAVGDGSLLFRP
ncbi:PREDICTED: cation/calcium exchanger 4-like [Ipomoea nil]|uniref:cation/calcium exchanger 4-like n=1 Tax=Ipomoea nil TaxID=35883 RepID=UPI00090158D3|nr:PREDICTED: cation/calcium exchanger 4-like [Ipomoea nil]